jgi:hypothetical protein
MRFFIDHIARVEGVARLDEYNVSFFFCDRHVFHSVRDNEEFARANDHIAIAQSHRELPLDYEEHLILFVVMMPDELTFQLYYFHVTIIDFSNDARVAIVAEKGKLLREINFVMVHKKLKLV